MEILIGSILLFSVAFACWMVCMLDKGGREMHKYLNSGEKKYIRHVGGFGESTFTEIK